MERSGLCALVGAVVGAAATYAVMKNKDKIIEKFDELEDKVEEKLREKGITVDKAKEMYKKASENVHSAMDRLSAMVHSKDISQSDKEQILSELQSLREKVERLS